jgi:hypothetical protein
MLTYLVIGLALAAGDPGAYAREIRDAGDLVGGPLAAGRIGDFLIGNERIRVVISAADHPSGFARTGGHIIDAAPASGGGDLLQLVFVYLDDTFPRQAAYEEVRVEDGSIVAVGEDTHDPANRITTTYALSPGSDALLLRTVVRRQEGTGVVEAFELGEAVQWGGTVHTAPGLGTDLPFRTRTAWIAGIGEGISYGFLGDGEFDSKNGKAWSDPVFRTVDLVPGEEVVYERRFVVADGGTVSIARRTWEGTPRIARVSVDPPIPGVRIDVLRGEDHPLCFALTDDGGRAEVPVPGGRVRLRASTRARGSTRDVPFSEEVRFRLGDEGRLRFAIREGDDLVPGRLTFEGVHGTPDPDLGPPNRAAGARNLFIAATGEGEVLLPPGRYVVTASRGPEYSIDARLVTIREEGSAEEFGIRRVVDTSGFLSCDFHQHAADSADSGTSMRDRVASNLAEGLELMVSTDHDYVSDFGPIIESMGVGRWIQSIRGDEVTAGGGGHFNAFPLRRDPSAPRGGAVDPWGKTAEEIFGDIRALPGPDRVIQVNHPRSSSSGYFRSHRLDAAKGETSGEGFSWDFDAVEVMNGQRIRNFELVLQDWFHLLNLGRRYLATGNSDTHDVFHDRAGYPRNYVRVDEDRPGAVTPEGLVEALKTGRCVVVSNGPFLTMYGPEGASIGSEVVWGEGDVPLEIEVRAPDWMPLDRLEIYARGDLVVRRDLKMRDGAWKGTIPVPLEEDGWIVAVVRGDRDMEPVIPAPAVAFTNPIWIDRE